MSASRPSSKPTDPIAPEESEGCERKEALPAVLAVDDEPDNLEFVRRVLCRSFRVFTARNGEEAIDELAAHEDLAAVVCDQRMPDITGIDVLVEAQRLAPRAARVLVTAYGDAEVLAAAINRAQVHRFVAKPCEPGELEAAVHQAVEIQRRGVDTERLARDLRKSGEALVKRPAGGSKP